MHELYGTNSINMGKSVSGDFESDGSPKELDMVVSTDFELMTSERLRNHCIHLLCLQGEGSFVFDDRCYHFRRNDLIVISHLVLVSNLAPHPDLKVIFFSADYRFLQALLPANSYSIGGSISLYEDPIIPLSEENRERLLEDIRRIEERQEDRDFRFYRELMGSLCLTLIYDIFEFHASEYGASDTTERAAYVVRQLMQFLSSGDSRTHREVSYYADKLHVSVKYLSNTVRRVTGGSVTSYIDRYAVPILKEYLNDERYSLIQISDLMSFASLSYFSRYCKKHLGMSPSKYRQSLQPGFEASIFVK